MGGLVFLAAPFVALFVWCVFFGEFRARRRERKRHKEMLRRVDEQQERARINREKYEQEAAQRAEELARKKAEWAERERESTELLRRIDEGYYR